MLFGLPQKLINIICQIRTDGDNGVGAFQGAVLQFFEKADEEFGGGEFKIGKLLGKARVHVVDEFEPEERLERQAEEDRLFMGVDKVVAVAEQQPDGFEKKKNVQEKLEGRRADLDFSQAS
jgi:hypothetical protein